MRNAELFVAALLTFEAIVLRIVAATSAGPLWRDEANTVGVATLPTVREVWQNLNFDSFPVFWILIVRGLSELAGPANDPAFRLLGLAIGVAIVAALWFYARSLHYSLPLASLALLALTPSLIVWGDSMRGYGFGIFVTIVFAALLWRFVEVPTAARFGLALILGILSVHVLYYNAVSLFAFAVAAGTVAALKRAWKTLALVALIGILAVLSLLPYAETIRKAGDWVALVRMQEYTFLYFLSRLYLTLLPGGPWSFVVWIELFLLAIIVTARGITRSRKLEHTERQIHVATFSLVALVVGSAGVFIFLKTLSYFTQPWYYLTLLALVGVCIDSISGSMIRGNVARTARLLGAMLLGVITFIPALHASQIRMTNLDLVARSTQELASRNDLIVLNAWYNGVTWNRYYNGATPWMTIPPLKFYRWQRPDMVKEHMTEADQMVPVQPIDSAIGRTLRAGNRVFIVGYLPTTPPGKKPIVMPAAPMPGNQWPSAIYTHQWGAAVSYFLQRHAVTVTLIPVNAPHGVSEFEDLSLRVVSGWKP